ncbi:LapA family protein [Pseudarthrobacter sp. R1]|uniref:lipopolysaccharide assembly protein LapA domain-containing protein n=1 Tax=Pseudarthrobacter sp. R1 TaxID=2944934 RepID=UPI002109D0CF|nr:LapA family protein [Pseudarthrobacter sp. R1]MCQ6272384.1 LapA family protein [Pseudarthrobacter sp. R1]
MSAGQYTPGTDGPLEPRDNGTPPADRTGTPGVPAARPADSSPGATPPPAGAGEPRVTRAGVVWAAVVAALALLILLIIFILQNQDLVLVRFLGFEGSLPLGMALFIASVTGGVLVAAAGGARILQLRANARRARATQRR